MKVEFVGVSGLTRISLNVANFRKAIEMGLRLNHQIEPIWYGKQKNKVFLLDEQQAKNLIDSEITTEEYQNELAGEALYVCKETIEHLGNVADAGSVFLKQGELLVHASADNYFDIWEVDWQKFEKIA